MSFDNTPGEQELSSNFISAKPPRLENIKEEQHARNGGLHDQSKESDAMVEDEMYGHSDKHRSNSKFGNAAGNRYD